MLVLIHKVNTKQLIWNSLEQECLVLKGILMPLICPHIVFVYVLTVIRVSSHLTKQSEPITACPVFSGQVLQKDNSMTEVVLLPFEIVLLTWGKEVLQQLCVVFYSRHKVQSSRLCSLLQWDIWTLKIVKLHSNIQVFALHADIRSAQSGTHTHMNTHTLLPVLKSSLRVSEWEGVTRFSHRSCL